MGLCYAKNILAPNMFNMFNPVGKEEGHPPPPAPPSSVPMRVWPAIEWG